MSKSNSAVIFVFLFAVLLASFFPAKLNACSLAKHDWVQIGKIEIPTAAPLLPLAEFSMLFTENFSETEEIIWVSEHNVFSALFGKHALFPLTRLSKTQIESWLVSGLPTELPKDYDQKRSWLSNAKVTLATPKTNLKSLLAKSSAENPPIIMGSANSVLQIAFFADENSNCRCIQTVILQKSSTRAVQLAEKPVIKEVSSVSYISVVTFDIKNLMSFSFYPLSGLRVFPVSNEELVSKLISIGLLKYRTVEEQTPESYNLPEIK